MPRMELDPIHDLFVTIGKRPFLLTVEEMAVSGRDVKHIGLAPPWEDHVAWSKLVKEATKRGRSQKEEVR